MDNLLKSHVSKRRLLLGNPYAYVEYLESEVRSEQADLPLEKRIQENRKVLQDPYAFLDDSGGFSAIVCDQTVSTEQVEAVRGKPNRASGNAINGVKLTRRSSKEIESLAKEMHARLWREKNFLWDGAPPADPIELLDPEVALRLVGYDYSVEDGLGTYRGRGGNIEVAGLINRDTKTVHVSRQFPLNVRMFTAAHELGHAVLHATAGGVHRDKPLDGALLSRNSNEWEADKFATYFLLPEKLVKTRFFNLFGTTFFELNDDTAFALTGLSVEETQAKCRARRGISRMLAGAERYSGRHFISLATQFHVSIESMAIRIEELALLA